MEERKNKRTDTQTERMGLTKVNERVDMVQTKERMETSTWTERIQSRRIDGRTDRGQRRNKPTDTRTQTHRTRRTDGWTGI